MELLVYATASDKTTIRKFKRWCPLATKITLKASRKFGPELEGEALVSRDPIHFTLDVASETGIIMGIKHDLYGKSIADRILVMPSAKGGVQSAMSIAQLLKDGRGPKALLYDRTNPIMVHGAVLTNTPIMDRFNQNPVEVIKSGDWVRVKPEHGVVEVERK